MDKNIKMISAKLALPYIKDNMIVGLGGGTTMGYVVNFLEKNKVSKIKIVTPSQHTKELCLEAGYEVIDTGMINHVDVAFDGCDYVDENLYALKSGGGIHTDEKLIAKMADDYILLVDESKVEKKLSFVTPIVLECIPSSRRYVEMEVQKLGGKAVPRTSYAKDGFTLSDHGNLLMDAEFDEVDDIPLLNQKLKNICGVVETSLFTDEVTKVLIASNEGYKVMKRC